MAARQEASSSPGIDARKFYRRSCAPEVSEPVTGLLRGELPAWLQGRLLRNGPGLSSVGPDRYNHAFDGPALLRQFTIENGRVLYQNRFLRSEAYVRNRRANRIVVSEFGTAAHPDPCATVFERVASYFSMDLTDNALVNVMPVGDEVYTLTETPDMTRVDPASLETLEKKTLRELVAVHIATAHPHLDPVDGATYNIGTRVGARHSFVLVHFPPSGSESSVDRARAVGTIPLQSRISVPYIHSFGMTENWVVVLEQSLSMHLPSMLAARYLGYKAYMNALKFDAKKNVRFHVMNKKTGELHPAVFESAAFFTFHHINAFEQGDELVVDIICFDDDSIIRSLDYTVEKPVVFKMGQMRRFSLPLNRGPDERVIIEPRELAKGKLRGELPRINQGRNGKPYKYSYSLSNVEGEEHRAFVSKLDVTTGDWLRWERQGWFPSEPVFVARPGAVEEDDGVVLSSLLHEENEKKLALVVLDAKTFKQLALAEFDCPSSIPADFHGWFLEKQA
nr:carotenoid isomerooxygenase-like [Dermacentor andersoni]